MKKILALIKQHRYRLGLILVLIAAVLVYYNCLRVSGWLSWDDMNQVYGNRDITKLSWPALAKIFKTFYLEMYQPLATASYALEYHFVQTNPWLYHLDNLLLHLLNIVLVFWLTKKLFRADNLAILSSALFAIHPLALESVAWVSARSTLLFVGWYLLALIAYLKYLEQKKLRYYWLVLLCFLLSLASKTLAVTLPVSLLLLDYYRRRRIGRGLFLEKIPFFVLSLAFGLVAMKARSTQASINLASHLYSWPNKISLWLYSLGDYLEKIIVPGRLSTFYAWPEQINGYLPWDIYLVAGGFLLLLVWLIVKFRTNQTLVFLSLFYLTNLALTVQIKFFSRTIIADRYAYLAGLSVIWLVALGYGKIIAVKPRYQNIIKILVIVYLIMLSLITANRTNLWQNDFIFWQRVVDQYPRDSFALSSLGEAFYEFKAYDQATDYLKQSIAIDGNNSDAFNSLGTVYFEQKDFKQAIEYYNQAVIINHTEALYFYNRACAITGLGDLKGALLDYERAVANSRPDDQYFDIYYLALANTKYKLKDYAGAVAAYDTALSLVKNPAEAYFYRGLSQIQLRQSVTGCQDLEEADKLGYKDAKKELTKNCQ